MQLPQVLTGWDKPAAFPGDAAPALSAYGFGLFVEDDPAFGRIVSHSGGYPGFGSNMRWHPASGTGVIALGNSTYAGMMTLATRLLDVVLRHREPPGHGYGVALAPAGHHGTGPWPETLAAREAVSALLRSWDDTQASRLFSPNVAQDAPFDERREVIAMIRERIGDFGDDAETAAAPSSTRPRTAGGGWRGSAAWSRRRSSSTPNARPACSPSPWPCRPRRARRWVTRWPRSWPG